MSSLLRLGGGLVRGGQRGSFLGVRMLHVSSRLDDIRAAALQKTLTTAPKALVAKDKLVFGHTFADHMLTVKWTAKGGWETPKINEYGPLSLDPSCSVFHYAFECFEGLKAYRDAHGKVRLFRPDKNMERMNRSVERLHLP
ncbi:branched-chain-amino-acid transaminase bat2, partial [Coemansia furcata]